MDYKGEMFGATGFYRMAQDNEISIEISFNTMDIEVHNKILTFDLATFIGTAGGSLGLFLGFTLTGFAEQVLDFFMRNWFSFLIEDKNTTAIDFIKKVVSKFTFSFEFHVSTISST